MVISDNNWIGVGN